MPLAEVVFDVQAPEPLGSFTKEHPNARVIVRFVAFEGSEARMLVTLAGPTEVTAPLLRALRDSMGGSEFEVLSITPYSVVIKASSAPDKAPWLAPAARFAEVFGKDSLLEPVIAEQGRLRIRGVAAQQMDTRRALEKLQEMQRQGSWEGFRVVHVSAFDPKALGERLAPLLEPDQDELLRLALAMGYYDTPRRCNLETIAQRVGFSVSPVHKKLKEAEHTLIRAHLEPDAPRAPRKRRAQRPSRTLEPGGIMREVTVRISGAPFAPSAFTAKHAGARIVYQSLADEPGILSHLHVVLAPPEAAKEFLALAESDPVLLDSEVLSRDAEHVSVKVRRRSSAPGSDGARGLGADPLQSVVAALGRDAYAKPAVCENGTVLGRVVLLRRLPEDELESMLQELARSAGWESVELVGVKDASLEPAMVARRPERLTDRQEEVLRIAHALGYYRTPRACTLEDVAGTLGVSANAVHKNLTAAEQRIIQNYVGSAL